MHITCFIHPLVDGHLGCFHISAIFEQVRVSVWAYVSISLGYISRSETVGLYITIYFFEELPDYFPKQLQHFTFPAIG